MRTGNKAAENGQEKGEEALEMFHGVEFLKICKERQII